MAHNVNYYIQDAKGDDGVLTAHLDSSVSADDAIAFAQTLWPLIEALITGGSVVCRVSLDVPAITSGAADAASDVQELAKFVFQTAEAVAKKVMTIPTFLESLFVPGSKVVDTTDADVAAFVTAMIDGVDTTAWGGSGVIAPTDYRETDLTALIAATEAWGKARK